jgi:hypothetical protein
MCSPPGKCSCVLLQESGWEYRETEKRWSTGRDGDRSQGLGVTAAAALLEPLGDALADAAEQGLSPVLLT